ncbi:hypothetical protein GE21DRAFT_5546 [Neurospora crassa]|uniref:Uncharacterized protein n=1 Tax=Neurospora crassa (strain ATCC 24698 / 74-OR23-1A / CBS 708.71 / DSM 1257 / FGSC 987) TaxID=367110 RepID=V5INR5_NEUCR|nr:hypothetical protein NCU16762 [Neurospora crassa OR74A]ESA42809.1 hypothetical protein NCU16762 [Neurospora crassa OR74A]KHE79107.1 hypothetical protein GE21DRAFT_5546 [Neurospora crassa]|eukprot:XP_011394373.1 hypothetical protein NCU16762 [Neurospora crassa OR74A]
MCVPCVCNCNKLRLSHEQQGLAAGTKAIQHLCVCKLKGELSHSEHPTQYRQPKSFGITIPLLPGYRLWGCPSPDTWIPGALRSIAPTGSFAKCCFLCICVVHFISLEVPVPVSLTQQQRICMCNLCIKRSGFLPFVLPLPKSFGTTKYRKLRYVERRTTGQSLLEVDRVVIPCFTS